ncbi:hypothetical protein COLO4_27215 [Corchorus olitorius]|uniref:Leucine-rich repeat-containing N-terminal plant-type domain-containing protein n=1 Tax=Corchorus olitorius TaxID=93759 RepID=A0A1R3HS16_9ROSI|nr:hypothetical protein COLO4_27215 [Corchorus olitorius]
MDMSKSYLVLSAFLVQYCFMVSYAMIVRNLSTDQHALVEVKGLISDPHNILANNWTDTNSVCNWIGVSCAIKHRRVRGLNLPNMNLAGTIPPHLGNLSFLASLNLSANNFHGHLPKELGHLSRLKLIDLSFNFFNAEVPSWFGRLDQVLHLALETIISQNQLSGFIPRSVGNLTRLNSLYIGGNSLEDLFCASHAPKWVDPAFNL